MHGHLISAEIDPPHHLERLPTPAPHPFEQIGNPRCMDLGVSGYTRDFRRAREERAHGVAN